MRSLSEHFTLEELTTTDCHQFSNVPTEGIVEELEDTAAKMEEVRLILGALPIHVNSGYRSPEVNKAVGGAVNSAHMAGFAVDFICPRFGSPLAICKKLVGSGIHYDQIIEEGTWVHISFDPRARHQVMTKVPGGGYQLGLPNE